MSDIYHEATETTGEQDTDRDYGEHYSSATRAGTAQEGELAGREESPAATWVERPRYYDEADFFSGEYDRAIDRLLASKGKPHAREESPAATWVDGTGSHDSDAEADTGNRPELEAPNSDCPGEVAP